MVPNRDVVQTRPPPPMTDYSDYFEDEKECLLVDSIIDLLKNSGFSVLEPPEPIIELSDYVSSAIGIAGTRLFVVFNLESNQILITNKFLRLGGDTNYNILWACTLHDPKCFDKTIDELRRLACA